MSSVTLPVPARIGCDTMSGVPIGAALPSISVGEEGAPSIGTA